MIERATASDADEIFLIESASIRCAWTHAQIVQAIADQRYVFFVLRMDGMVVGYASARIVDGEAEINNLAVKACERRKGYGRRLLTALMDEAKHQGAHEIFIEVEEQNTAARALYQRLGFCEIGCRKHYYGEARHAIVLKHGG